MNPIPERTPRRVLHLLDSIQPSGLEMMLLSSYVEWCHQGYKCDVLATAKEIGPLAGQMRAAGYGVYHIPFRSSLSLLPRASFVRDFFHLCRSGYDVVHIHHDAGPHVPALLAKLAGVRRIAVTLHGQCKYDGVLRLRKRWERQFVRSLGGRFGMISEVIAQTEWERFRNKGVQISNWIDTCRFRPASAMEREDARSSLGLDRDDFVIISVGNCSSLKNHESLLRAIALLPPETKAVYLHVGREDASLPEQKLAVDLGLAQRVRFLGPKPDPLPFLWAADVFAMPSLREGLGMAAIEAIAAGTPTLLSDNPGLVEAAAGTEVTVFASTTPESLADGLTRTMTIFSKHRREPALNDSTTIRKKYSVQRGVRSITEGLYA